MSTFASATAIASATKWVPLFSMVLFTLNGGKHQKKQSQTLSVNEPLVWDYKENEPCTYVQLVSES